MVSEKLETEATRLENETRQKISSAISAIESALEKWEATKKKPKMLEERINELKFSYKLFIEWETESLKGSKDFDSVITRLNEFENLCEKINERNN
ncbi:MAG: hypothetical protein Q7S22_00065 [Candidatus Micrarchaeota archaeon]|nr:hypothetical protein [Candidatus Micrarchaeota archaeon]